MLKTNNYSINTLINEWDGLVRATPSYDLLSKLDDDAGYDLIFIDYYTMRSITENADYLLQAIDWINTNKVNNALGVREQNVVMGISMGGLVSRYALAKRTKETNTNSTETKQLFTMDSPHQGANVPLGLQHFLYDFGEARIVKKIKDVSDELKAFYYLNTLPATQQQLILRVEDGEGNRTGNTFLAENGIYRSMVDYNSPYPFYAISNGSQCAVPVMAPSTLILQKDGNVATSHYNGFFVNNKYKLQVQVNALPQYGTTQQICSVVMMREVRIYWGIIGTGWKTTSNTPPRISPANTIPWDGVPGGTKTTETTGPISQSSTIPETGKQNTFLGNIFRSIAFLYINVNTNVQLPFSQKEFSFVPITSALDVQNVTASTFNQNFSYAVSGTNGSRAGRYISQEFSDNFYNTGHTDFYPRNAQWLYEEMENTTHGSDVCLSECPSNAGFSISGSELICGSNTYSVTGLNNSLSVAGWTVTPSNIVTSTVLGNTITLTAIPNTSGFITLSAAVQAAGCNAANPITKEVYIGKPIPVTTIQEYDETNSSCSIIKKIRYRSFNIASSYNWISACELPTPGSFINKGSGVTKTIAQINPCAGEDAGQFKTRVDATNACGTTQGTLVKIVNFDNVIYQDQACLNPTTVNSDNYFIIASPNPVTSYTSISLKYLPPPNPTAPAPTLNMAKIWVYNNSNQLINSVQLNNVPQYTLNTDSYMPGFYRLLVQNASGQWLEKIIVK